MSRAILTCAAALAAFTPTLAATGAERTLTTASGVQIRTAEPSAMTCEAIAASLVAIDGSGYRAGSPTTLSPDDMAIYAYETSLSVEYYWRCAADVTVNDSQSVFSSGFNN